MCLISKTRFPQVAKEDIVCYKELRKTRPSANYYLTPHLAMRVPKESKWPISIFPKEDPPFRIRKIDWYMKAEGYIHAYTRYKGFVYSQYSQSVVVECIIPKGTKYHISVTGDEICARRMILERIVDSI